jgi:hypothetical protein
MFHTFKVGYHGDAMKWDISIGENVCNFRANPMIQLDQSGIRLPQSQNLMNDGYKTMKPSKNWR